MKLPVLLLTVVLCSAGISAEPGATEISRWKDNRKAAFLLMFDDGWPSHWQVAVPELQKRGMIATFYINPAKGEYAKFPKEWEKVRDQGQVLANHTMTHKGADSPEAGVKEIEDCQAYLLKFIPGKEPRLTSFGMPGVPAWKLPKEQHQATLMKHHLIDRPPFNDHGVVYHLKTKEQMLALADKAISAGGMEYLVFHGVERITPNWKYQDFWAVKQDIFLPLLDALKERVDKGELWITDHVTWHKYDEERKAAAVTSKVEANKIMLELTSKADPAFYDQPLTLRTTVPATWKRCTVTQGDVSVIVESPEGLVQFDALPNTGTITLSPAK